MIWCFEIVQDRYDTAVLCANQFGVEGVRFHLKDATKSEVDWWRVGIVFMADAWWGPQRARALAHIAHATYPTAGQTVVVSSGRCSFFMMVLGIQCGKTDVTTVNAPAPLVNDAFEYHLYALKPPIIRPPSWQF